MSYKNWFCSVLVLSGFFVFFSFSKSGFADEDLVFKFEKFQDSVVPTGPEGAWDEGSIYNPIVVENEGTYFMFYIAEGKEEGLAGRKTGLATSDDGYTWTKSPKNPVFIADGNAAVRGVLVNNDLWILFYQEASSKQVLRATAPSPEGPWTFNNEPVLGSILPRWNKGGWPLGVVQTKTGYNMYFQGNNWSVKTDIAHPEIGVAFSTDTKTWTFFDNPKTGGDYLGSDPVFSRGHPDSWDEWGAMAGNPIFSEDKGWEWFYFGYGPYQKDEGSKYQMGYATSEDGIHWDRYGGNPIFTSDEPRWPLSYTIKIEDRYFIYYDHDFGKGGISLVTGLISKNLGH